MLFISDERCGELSELSMNSPTGAEVDQVFTFVLFLLEYNLIAEILNI